MPDQIYAQISKVDVQILRDRNIINCSWSRCLCTLLLIRSLISTVKRKRATFDVSCVITTIIDICSCSLYLFHLRSRRSPLLDVHSIAHTNVFISIAASIIRVKRNSRLKSCRPSMGGVAGFARAALCAWPKIRARHSARDELEMKSGR